MLASLNSTLSPVDWQLFSQASKLRQIERGEGEPMILETNSNRRGIICVGWNEVVALTKFFGRGVSQEAQRKTLEGVTQAFGAEGLDLMLMTFTKQDTRTDSFVDEILQEAHARIESGRSDLEDPRARMWIGSWDYGGPGVFHKSTLTITCLLYAGENGSEKDIFRWDFHAAYVGFEPEVRLATTLKRLQALNSISHFAVFPKAGEDRFAIDFQAILAPVLMALDSSEFATGTEVLAALVEVSNDPRERPRGGVKIGVLDNACVSLSVPMTRWNCQGAEPTDNWVVKGGELSGPRNYGNLPPDFHTKGFHDPMIVFTIEPQDVKTVERHTPEFEERVVVAAERVKALLTA